MIAMRRIAELQEQIQLLKKKIQMFPEGDTENPVLRERNIAVSTKALCVKSGLLPAKDGQALLTIFFEEMSWLQCKFDLCIDEILAEHEELQFAGSKH